MTAHRSKGLEDDFVILTGLKENIVGFPTKIEDDPILNIVLSSPETRPAGAGLVYCCVSSSVTVPLQLP